MKWSVIIWLITSTNFVPTAYTINDLTFQNETDCINHIQDTKKFIAKKIELSNLEVGTQFVINDYCCMNELWIDTNGKDIKDLKTGMMV